MKSFLLISLVAILFSCEGTKTNTAGPGSSDISSLEGTWDLTYVSTNSNFNALYPEAKPYMTIDVSGKRISGKTSCNNYSGALVVKGNTIDLTGPIAMTKMFCQGQGEPIFVELLPRLNTFSVEDSILTFYTDGTRAMEFIKRL